MQFTARNIGFGVLILLGLILALAPVPNSAEEQVSNKTLLEQLQQGAIYVQADELAHWIIDKDPGFQLVDLRSNADHDKYNIPGNVHFPFGQINEESAYEILDNEKMIILASNGNTRAGQAWILFKQMGYQEVYILAGGLNNWVNVFNNPKHPAGAYTDDELFTYQFRKAASGTLMGGATLTDESTEKQVKPKPVVRKRKKKEKKVDEGC